MALNQPPARRVLAGACSSRDSRPSGRRGGARFLGGSDEPNGSVHGGGAKILIRRDHQVDVTSLPCRVFLGRGVSGRDGWHAFARILVRQLVELGCVTGWGIIVEARTAIEDDELADSNEYGAIGKDLVSLDIDAEHHLATYSVSSREIDHMNVPWDELGHAEATADAIIEHLMAEEGLLDDDEERSLERDGVIA